MTKAERAVIALREAADAVDALPQALRRRQQFWAADIVSTSALRAEAAWIESVAQATREESSGE
jgi:hypothetical protein